MKSNYPKAAKHLAAALTATRRATFIAPDSAVLSIARAHQHLCAALSEVETLIQKDQDTCKLGSSYR